MNDYLLMFKVEHILSCTKITNNSQFNLFISLRPVKPKRKYKDILLVPSNTFKIYEQIIDLTTVSFYLTPRAIHETDAS